MPDEAVHMRNEALVKQPALRQSSYLGRALRKAWARFTKADPSQLQDQRSDGLEALDMLGGWKGADCRRSNRFRR
ncbi:hypothetical protein [Aminobacter carboxidus]|uniref:Uncharacterized protein n=1 Tax=Aminobacter carboxidus TaxID=376165 RepID=A0ABR9GMR5_9HYPH|nr:hypothetical protein [Aminobacter carboxidus]MBE1204885.1 hypothetical protein [Aminobacter carboxidus]